MGLLSKLFGDNKEAAQAAKDILGGIFGEAAQKAAEENREPSSRAQQEENVWNMPDENAFTKVPAGPSGESWGPVMPAEMNQFNSGNTWWGYFEEIFASDFPQYRVEKEAANAKRNIYTFYNGAEKVLVIELMSQSCDSKKLRERCQASGLPYLRFYYDHEGWWNTRSYVVRRMNDQISWS